MEENELYLATQRLVDLLHDLKRNTVLLLGNSDNVDFYLRNALEYMEGVKRGLIAAKKAAE